MSDNESKLPGKKIQIVLTIIFVLVALGLVMIVKPFGSVHVPDKAAPGNAPAGVPPSPTAPPK
ncbi:MAG: hypothetical protein SGJ27_17875 [Candidatus Melainabacteria bacterium]|nr:hypothetical protein [Candidatus Melainabacteria bacterium]